MHLGVHGAGEDILVGDVVAMLILQNIPEASLTLLLFPIHFSGPTVPKRTGNARSKNSDAADTACISNRTRSSGGSALQLDRNNCAFVGSDFRGEHRENSRTLAIYQCEKEGAHAQAGLEGPEVERPHAGTRAALNGLRVLEDTAPEWLWEAPWWMPQIALHASHFVRKITTSCVYLLRYTYGRNIIIFSQHNLANSSFVGSICWVTQIEKTPNKRGRPSAARCTWARKRSKRVCAPA